MSYLTYTEYQELGGKIGEAAFTSLLLDVESKLNYHTQGRIAKLDTVPQAVKNLCFKLVTFYSENHVTKTSPNVISYSNGIESIGYATSEGNSTGSTSFDSTIYSIIKEYLWEYPELLYRGRRQW